MLGLSAISSRLCQPRSPFPGNGIPRARGNSAKSLREPNGSLQRLLHGEAHLNASGQASSTKNREALPNQTQVHFVYFEKPLTPSHANGPATKGVDQRAVPAVNSIERRFADVGSVFEYRPTSPQAAAPVRQRIARYASQPGIRRCLLTLRLYTLQPFKRVSAVCDLCFRDKGFRGLKTTRPKSPRQENWSVPRLAASPEPAKWAAIPRISGTLRFTRLRGGLGRIRTGYQAGSSLEPVSDALRTKFAGLEPRCGHPGPKFDAPVDSLNDARLAVRSNQAVSTRCLSVSGSLIATRYSSFRFIAGSFGRC